MTTEKTTASANSDAGKKPNFIVRLWRWFWRPAPATSLGVLVVLGFVAGAVFLGAFNWTFNYTNSEPFCLTCHSMRDYNLAELKSTVHYNNRSGMRATCTDCHIPKEFHNKVIRKIAAAKELWGHIVGTIDTPEKFAERRIVLARSEWTRMKNNDSQECRNCHDYNNMDFMSQEPRSAQIHADGIEKGQTCIDCHKGIAHKLPPNAEQEYQKLISELGAKK
jgi:Nitrate/TMAO reductases, membrane-bound tetraheme cytochrome c subunit